MAIGGDWVTIDIPEFETLARPVVIRSQTLPARHIFPPHRHAWNQVVYATSGTLVVTVEDRWYVITPEQAIWVPTSVDHTTGALDGAAFRNLYVADGSDLGMPDRCTVFTVTPFLRALIVELTAMAERTEEPAYADRVEALILDNLRRLKPLAFDLPWPRSPGLRRVCEALYEAPDDPRTAAEWGREIGVSARTLARRFEDETGLSPRLWRHRLRLFRALEWLGAGRGVTQVALDLGYASPSAFTYMFRAELGCPPSQWLRRCGAERPSDNQTSS